MGAGQINKLISDLQKGKSYFFKNKRKMHTKKEQTRVNPIAYRLQILKKINEIIQHNITTLIDVH